jgi:hypothetical protein
MKYSLAANQEGRRQVTTITLVKIIVEINNCDL